MSETLIYIGLWSVIIGVLLVGLIIIYILIRNIKNRQRKCTELVEGKIVDFNEIDKEKKYKFVPIYEYTYEDKVYKTKSRLKGEKDKTKLGETSPVYINVNNPEEMYQDEELNGFGSQKVWYIIFSIVVISVMIFEIGTFITMYI